MLLVWLSVSLCYRHLTRYIGTGDLGWVRPGKFSFSLLSICHGADVEVMEEVERLLYLSNHTALGHCHLASATNYSRTPAYGCVEGLSG